MNKLARGVLVFVMTVLTAQPAILFAPPASAAAAPAAASSKKDKNKKKIKHKYKNKQLKILKGHHGKHKGRPA